MRTLRKGARLRSNDGQALIIAVGIILILLICIPSIVFINHMGIRHQTQTQKQGQGKAIADAGIAFAAAALSATQQTWIDALGGTYHAPIAPCDGTANVPGTQFRLTCAKYPSAAFPALQLYELAVVSTAWLPGPDGNLMPAKSEHAFLSQKTLGAYLPSGIGAPAALYLVKTPSLTANALSVHWGPIVCLDNLLWTLVNPLDKYKVGGNPPFQGFPRKFSNGGITGAVTRSPDMTTSAITTDNKEYWAFAGQHFPTMVNEFYYKMTKARSDNYLSMNGILCAGITQVGTGTGSGNYVVPASANAHFGSTYSVPALSNKVIYVDGDATFDSLALDLGTDGAFIVNGNLTLGNPGGSVLPSVRVPPTADQEYPYWPTAVLTQWPCKGQWSPNGASCTWGQTGLPGGLNFHGFLWVKGNLTVTTPGWVIAGTVMVGDLVAGTGQLILSQPNDLTILYDDQINRAIRVNPH